MNYLGNYKINQQLCEFNLNITNEYSKNYLKSCGIGNYESEFANPTELATLSLKYFLEKFPIPEGSIHTAQEISIKEKILKNKELKCSITLSQSKEIKNSLFIKVRSEYSSDENIVGFSEGTLIIPKN
tara:strand:- start:411 stop:794 length:384 start_codon:yes stop_codon:yes gene_type:complete